MSLRKSKTIDFMGRKVQVWELTVPEVHAFLQKMRTTAEEMQKWLRERRSNPDAPEPATEQQHVLDLLMDSSMPFELVIKCVPELTEADLCSGDVAFSDLAPLYHAVEEVNPFFMRMADKVMRTNPWSNQDQQQTAKT